MNSATTAKEILAKLMASENINIEHANVTTASFNMESRVLTLPMWENAPEEVVDLLIGHEVGHALYTPKEGWHDAVVEGQSSAFKSYLNVIEDARIEKLIQRKFPGLKFQFIRAYKKLMQDGFFQVDSNNMESMLLIDRINLRFKCGQSIGVKFNKDEMKWIPLIEKVEKWEEVVEIAKAMFVEEKEKQQQKKQLMDELKSEGFDENQDESDSFDESDDYSDEYPEDIMDGELEDSEESTQQEDSQIREDDIASKTEKNLHNNVQQEYSNSSVNLTRIYLDLETKVEKFIVSYDQILNDIKNHNQMLKTVDCFPDNDLIDLIGQNAKKEFLINNKKTINYMVKEFEMRRRGQIALRVRESKTGMIDTLKMNSYMFNDDIFRKISNVPQGKNHGLIIYIDWSASMSDYLYETVEQLLNLVYFCRQVNIPFRVFGFTSGYPDVEGVDFPKGTEKQHIVTYDKNFRLLEFFNSNMNSSKFSKMVECLLAYSKKRNSWKHRINEYLFPSHLGLHSTPLIDCALSSFQIFEDFKNTHKVDLVTNVFLTDGESDSFRITYPAGEDGHRFTFSAYSLGGHTSPIIKLVNPITKKEMKVSGNGRNSTLVVKSITEMFRKHTNSSVMGIRLINKRQTKNALSQLLDDNGNYNEYYEKIESMKKNKFIDLSILGYDRFMVIPVETMETSNGQIEVGSTATKTQIKSAFRKASKGRLTSRIMLNKYMETIA